jgi:hypothetical protein
MIPNPTVTHADKIMQAILACSIILKGLSRKGTNLEMKQLKELEKLARKLAKHKLTLARMGPLQ